MIDDEVEYCPECTWSMEHALFPGNNGLERRAWCSKCGYYDGRKPVL